METRNGKTDKMPMNRVILMTCGRYNPPTHMHLRMFERARDHLHTLRTHTVVGGIISLVNDCSKNDPANSKIRCDLLNLALETSDWICLSTWEVRQNSLKSIRETLQYHQNVLNSFLNSPVDNNVNTEDIGWIPDNIKNNADSSPVQIKLLCGADLLESLSTPEVWSEEDISEIVERYGLVVIGKEGGYPYKCIYHSDILSKHMHNIHVVTEWIPNEVNSTGIRQALRRGESVKYLLQDSVIEAIYRNGIYDAKRISRWCGRSTMDSMEKSRVILMSCGSYNPPTHMHLRMFERARDHLHNLGTHMVIGGVISPVHDAYAKKDLESGDHRREMLKLALADSDWIKLSTWELRQPGWTKTRKSLHHHQNLLAATGQGRGDDNRNEIDNEDLEWIPDCIRNNDNAAEQTTIQIKLLCGGDLLESFATPGLWAEEDIAEIVGQYGLIVITRNGSNPYKFIDDSDVLSKHLHNIQIVNEWIPNEVSSSRIRRALKRGESVKYLLQDAVIDYVYKNGIYGANRSSTIKLELSSNYSSTDYLNVEDVKYHDNAFLTPSPSDICMQDTNPCNANTATTTTTLAESSITMTTNDDELSDSVLQKNLHNNCRSPRYSDDQSSTSSIENTELAREKFFRSIVNDSLHFGGESSSSLLLLQQQSNRAHSQIDSQIEMPSSARARNELLAFQDTTESELATLCDNTYSEDREDVLSITYEESSEDLNESSVRNNKDCKANNSSDKANSENTTSTKDEIDANESLAFDTLEDSDSHATKFETNFEIDGRYLKSLVNSKKSPKKIDDDERAQSNKEDSTSTAIESVPQPEEVKIENKQVDEKPNKEVKLFDEDISYIKRLRLIINDKPPENGKNQRQLQGSLDSINLKESILTSRTAIESMSKKSKSFESIKRNAPMSFKTSEISYCDSVSKIKSDSTSQLVTALEFDAQTDEFCSACCFATNNEQPSSTDVFYTMRSNCSSPGDGDSTECDICSSCNLRDSNDALNSKSLTTVQSLSETSEICEICGEPATNIDEPLTDEPKSAIINCRLMPLNLPKAKSTIEISRGTYRMSTLDDDRFEIDNCGLQDCKLRASLNICNKPEPLYVNVMPRPRQFVESTQKSSNKQLRSGQPYSESDLQISQETRFAPKDEVTMSRSLSIGGGKRLNRKGSYAKKSTIDRTQEKRRYSSVDNLQNRMYFKSSGEKFSKSKFMTSADSIRPTRISRSRSLRRSADNVGRFDASGDNLDSLEENVDTDENGTPTGGTAPAVGNMSAKVKLRDSDTIKMILTKHGRKHGSQVSLPSSIREIVERIVEERLEAARMNAANEARNNRLTAVVSDKSQTRAVADKRDSKSARKVRLTHSVDCLDFTIKIRF